MAALSLRRGLRRLIVASAVVLCVLAAGGAESARAARARDVDVKAAFLLKFPDFVEWPAGALGRDTPLTVGVVGADAVADAVEELVRSGATTRRVLLRRFADGEPVSGCCHVVFVGGSGRAEERVIEGLATYPALTVTDAGGTTVSGSVIAFVIDQGKLRFDVSLAAAERKQLRVSARLLSVARQVTRGAT